MADAPLKLYDLNGVERFNGTGPAALAIRDLGTFHAVDLIVSGAQVVLDVPAGTYVQIAMGTAGYVAPDNNWTLAALIAADYTDNVEFWTSASTLSAAIANSRPGWVIRGTPVVVSLLAVFNAPDAWQANHAYSALHYLLVGTHYWVAEADGTSGPTMPDFAGNEGGTVVDNDITWDDNGVAPTQGTVHLYAISATP